MNKLQLAQFLENVIGDLSDTCRNWNLDFSSGAVHTSKYTEVPPSKIHYGINNYSEFICDTVESLSDSYDRNEQVINLLRDLGMSTGFTTFRDIPIEKRQLVRAIWLTIVAEMLELEHREETKE